MQPTLRQFEVFLAVAKAASFRAAAETMHLSQPALSQHVAEMERELGARLFDRLGRKVALTEAGRILEEHALRLFASVTSAREAVADLSELKGGSLVIGASTTPGIYVLPGIIAAFQGKYPRVVLSLRLGNSALIEELIRRNEVDLGVVGGHPLRPGEECVTAGLLDEPVRKLTRPWSSATRKRSSRRSWRGWELRSCRGTPFGASWRPASYTRCGCAAFEFGGTSISSTTRPAR